MTLIFNQSDWEELCQGAPVLQPKHLKCDEHSVLSGIPEHIGHGFSCDIDLSQGMELNFSDRKYHQDLRISTPAHPHLVQICIFLSGNIYFDAVHPNLGGERGYFSGSGISPGYVEKRRAGERLTTVNVEIEAHWLREFMQAKGQSDAAAIEKFLFQGEDWKASVYPKVTPVMRAIARQMWHVPYQGMAKQMYLQAKVFELLALHLDLFDETTASHGETCGLKPDTIDRLHHARGILTTELEDPPSLPELAKRVGVSDRTLLRGFKTLFNTTVVGYLKQQRLKQAEQLLRQGTTQGWHSTVAEVANRVGYSNLGHFSVAFKQRFGITPSQCLAGKIADFE